MIIVESASITDRGRKRQANEDAMVIEDGLGLYAVADGMGGHLAGEIASQLVVATIGDYIKKAVGNDDGDQFADFDDTLSREANRLLGSIRMSNRVVYEASLANKAYRGMGSTVAAVYFTESTLIAANVGDSPIYLVRDGKIKLLSVPHTYLAEQKALNHRNAAKLGTEFKHVLTRAVGVENDVKTDIYEIQCFKDDILVISSDGLNNKVSAREILELACNNGPDAACKKLVALANNRGGDDNITVIVLKVKLVKISKPKINRFLALVKRNPFKILTKI